MPHANQLIQQSQPRLRGLSPAPTAQLHRANGRPGSAIRGPAPSPLPAPAPGRAPHLWSALCGPTPPTFATPCPRTWRTAPPTRARSDRRPTAPLPCGGRARLKPRQPLRLQIGHRTAWPTWRISWGPAPPAAGVPPPARSALRAPPSASRSSRAAAARYPCREIRRRPPAEFDRQIHLVAPVALPAVRFPCLGRFPGATLPGLLGELQASPRGRMTRRIGRIRGERGNIHFPAPTTALQAARHQPRQRARQAIALGVLELVMFEPAL